MSDWASGLAARLRKEEGQGLTEYVAILGFVMVACVLTLTALGLLMPVLFNTVTAAFP